MTKKKFYPLLLVIVYSLLGLTMPAAVTQYSLVVGEITAALGESQKIVLLADTMRSISLVIFMLLSNRFYHKFGMKASIIIGIFAQLLPQFFYPTAVHLKSLPLLYFLKAFQGMNSIAFPLLNTAIVMWTGDKNKGLATAIFNGSFMAGSGIGSWISGIVTKKFGFEASFYAIGLLCLIFAIPAILLTKDRYPEIRKLPESKNNTKLVLNMPVTWFLTISLAANTWVNSAVSVDMSVYSLSLGNSYDATGTMMLFVSVGTVLSSTLSGFVSDRISFKSKDSLKARCKVQSWGYILAAIACILLPFVGKRGIVSIGICAFFMMFGSNWAGGVYYSLPSEVYSKELVVDGNGFCTAAANIPNPISPLVVGVLLGTAGFWTLGWLSCGVCCIISLIATFLIPKTKKP